MNYFNVIASVSLTATNQSHRFSRFAFFKAFWAFYLSLLLARYSIKQKVLVISECSVFHIPAHTVTDNGSLLVKTGGGMYLPAYVPLRWNMVVGVPEETRPLKPPISPRRGRSSHFIGEMIGLFFWSIIRCDVTNFQHCLDELSSRDEGGEQGETRQNNKHCKNSNLALSVTQGIKGFIRTNSL